MNLAGSPIDFIIVFVAGVGVSFTPCVYPLLPITVGYVGAFSGGSRAKSVLISVIYALGVAMTYSLLGAVASLSGRIFGELSGTPWPYLVVGNICIFFGLVVFDVFELPSFYSVGKYKNFLTAENSSPTQQRKAMTKPVRAEEFSCKGSIRIKPQGFISIFLFGMVAGLAVSPCTAPVLGSILAYVATKQNVFYGMILLFCFAYGACTTVILVGTFSGVLSSLPKAGNWLHRVKIAFGVILIGMGEYFLIQAGKYMI